MYTFVRFQNSSSRTCYIIKSRIIVRNSSYFGYRTTILGGKKLQKDAIIRRTLPENLFENQKLNIYSIIRKFVKTILFRLSNCTVYGITEYKVWFLETNCLPTHT